MPEIDVSIYIHQLRKALPYVPPVSVKKIKALHDKGDLGGVVKLIRRTMNVNVRLTVHWTNAEPPSGLGDAPAWIRRPQKMPYYGTRAFNEVTADLFIRKEFANTRPYDQFALMVAHELSHIVLDSIEHPLRLEEKAVDLTAMLLGFSYLYRRASRSVQQVDYKTYQRNQLGYLSDLELDEACNILLPASVRRKRAVASYARASAGLLILVGVVFSAWAIPTLSAYWRLHVIVVAQQDQLRSMIPLRFGDFGTLVGAHAGLTSLMRVYKLAVTPDDPMTSQQIAELKVIVRRDICSTDANNIGSGISYMNKYLDARDNLITSFETVSCP